MRLRTAAPLALAVIAVAGSLAPAQAASKKPMTGKYSVSLPPAPDLTEEQGCDGPSRIEGQTVHVKKLTFSAPGKLVLKVTDFGGDWDVSLWNSAGTIVGEGGGTSTPNTTPSGNVESLTYKAKKKGNYFVHLCNFAGTPSANVKYTFTYS